jgi:DNA polymerase-3 subunit beta
MRFTVPTSALLDAVSYASTVVASKSPKRILECLALRASKSSSGPRGSGVEIEATDLDVALRQRLPDAKVEEEGAAVVPAARLVSVLREVATKEVTLVGTEGRLEIDTPDCHFRLNGDDPAQFPVLPDFPASGVFKVPCGVLRGMIRRTVFATAKEAGRFALHGVQFRVAGGELELVGTDGRRLARAKHALAAPTTGDVKVIVGAKALSLVERLAADDATNIEVAIEERRVLFRTSGASGALLAARLLDGAFPSYEDVIPKKSARGFGVNVDSMATALRRASLLTTREAQSVQMHFEAKRLTISSRAPEVGEAKISVDIPYDEAPERLGFNPSFLLDALKVMDPQRDVRFEFSSSKAPCRMTDGDDYVYVVAPLSVAE